MHKQTGQHYAMKNVKKETIESIGLIPKQRPDFSSTSPFVVELVSVFEEGDSLYSVVDFVDGTTLQDEVKSRGKLEEDPARFYLAEIVLALEHLHRNNVIAR